jgi:hypothetical protein
LWADLTFPVSTWNREQRMSRAETIFLESLHQRLTV